MHSESLLNFIDVMNGSTAFHISSEVAYPKGMVPRTDSSILMLESIDAA